MYDSFAQAVHDFDPELKIALPLYEPVMGGVIEEALLIGGAGTIQALEQITNPFDGCRYKTEWN
jgi:hypothetical protein